MYRLNPLPRKVLIVTDEVISQAPIGKHSDPLTLQDSIQIAEDRWIVPMIGYSFYDDFRKKKNVVVDSINKSYLEGQTGFTVEVGEMVNSIELVDNEWYVTLWNEYLWKLIAECVAYTASPTNWSRFTAQGELFNNPKTVAFASEGSGANSVELKDMQWKMDKLLQDRIDPIIAAMKAWVTTNYNFFPLYPSTRNHNTPAGVSTNRKSGWIHMYDNERKGCYIK